MRGGEWKGRKEKAERKQKEEKETGGHTVRNNEGREMKGEEKRLLIRPLWSPRNFLKYALFDWQQAT